MKKKLTVSVIIPCHNEESGIGPTIISAKAGIAGLPRNKYSSEILVVDNNSTDKSAAIARLYHVRVIREMKKGYGRAYKTGFTKSSGDYLVIGDADNTYDFRDIPRFVKELEGGADLVLGNRFTPRLSREAMPTVNRIIGNPLLTVMINIFYRCRIRDTQTGYRAFTKQALIAMDLKSNGMEFASEMIIKAIGNKLTIREIPVSYARRSGLSKLSPLSDAWRHIQAILMYSPTYALILPGLVLTVLGSALTFLLLPGPITIGKYFIDIHTMIAGVLMTVLGTHIMLIGLFARVYTVNKLHIGGGPLTDFIMTSVTRNRLFIIGAILLTVSIAVIATTTVEWILSGFSALAKQRLFIATTGLATIGSDLIFSSLLVGLLSEES